MPTKLKSTKKKLKRYNCSRCKAKCNKLYSKLGVGIEFCEKCYFKNND